jgi:hypothetical protein
MGRVRELLWAALWAAVGAGCAYALWRWIL